MAIKTQIGTIVGEQLSAVSFVQDYVEFHFDGKILRSLNPPNIYSDGQSVSFPHVGSRDKLCSPIGKDVVDLLIKEGDKIEVIFAGGAIIEVPLALENQNGPEAAHFVSESDGSVEVW